MWSFPEVGRTLPSVQQRAALVCVRKWQLLPLAPYFLLVLGGVKACVTWGVDSSNYVYVGIKSKAAVCFLKTEMLQIAFRWSPGIHLKNLLNPLFLWLTVMGLFFNRKWCNWECSGRSCASECLYSAVFDTFATKAECFSCRQSEPSIWRLSSAWCWELWVPALFVELELGSLEQITTRSQTSPATRVCIQLHGTWLLLSWCPTGRGEVSKPSPNISSHPFRFLPCTTCQLMPFFFFFLNCGWKCRVCSFLVVFWALAMLPLHNPLLLSCR